MQTLTSVLLVYDSKRNLQLSPLPDTTDDLDHAKILCIHLSIHKFIKNILGLCNIKFQTKW